MAQLEILDSENNRTIVELGADPLPLGFDALGRVAWGASVERQVGEVVGDRLRSGSLERRLAPDEVVEVEGLQLVYRASAPDADQRASALGEIGNLLWTVGSVDELLGAVLEGLHRVLQVERASIALFDDDERLVVRAARGTGMELSETVTRAVVESGAAILTSEAAVSDDREDEITIDVRSVLCTPLRDAGETLGVLYVDSQGLGRVFDNDDLDFASALAHLASFALAQLTRTAQLKQENILLKRRLGLCDDLHLPSSSMEEIYTKVEKVSGFDATVLITGESGTGKEVIAREIHARSPRRDAPFVAVNCAAIPDTLLESELFGYAPRSGISGADPKGRPGKFEQADGGTIFLDEIGEMRPELQAKLLRVLQDKRVDRLNDTVSRDVELRIIVATNQKIEERVADGRFREDLYYRLNVVAIKMPPLRRRREDIPLLAEFFIRTYPGPEKLRAVRISKAAERALEAHDWPGNVRELKNCIEQALILGDGRIIRVADLPPPVRESAKTGTSGDLPPLADIERDHIARVLKATGWNKARSARVLGISKPTLYDKIRNYDLRQ